MTSRRPRTLVPHRRAALPRGTVCDGTMGDHSGAPASAPAPPAARRMPRVDIVHGDRREDDYAWLRQGRPRGHRAPPRRERLHRRGDAAHRGLPGGALRRDAGADQGGRPDRPLPPRAATSITRARRRASSTRSTAGRPVSADAPEEIDPRPQRAGGGPRVPVPRGLRGERRRPPARLLARPHRASATTRCTSRICATGALLPERVEKVSRSAWAADGRTLLLRHGGRRPSARTGLPSPAGRADRGRRSLLRGDRRAVPPARVALAEPSLPVRGVAELHLRRGALHAAPDPGGAVDAHRGARAGPRVRRRPRRRRCFYIRTNGGGRRNFRLVTAPVADPAPARWREVIPHREDVMLEDVDVFAGHYVVHEREDGLVRLRVTTAPPADSHHVAFPEPSYDVAPSRTPEFHAAAYRFRYQSLVTPASVFDYDVARRARSRCSSRPRCWAATIPRATAPSACTRPRADGTRIADLAGAPARTRRATARAPLAARGLRRLRHRLPRHVLVGAAEPARARRQRRHRARARRRRDGQALARRRAHAPPSATRSRTSSRPRSA